MAGDLIGAKSALKGFKRLEQAGQARVMRAALNAALNPIMKEIRRNAPQGDEPHETYKGRTVAPGFLSRNIKKSTKVSRDKKKVHGNVRPAPEAWYGAMPEHGGTNRDYKQDPWFYEAGDRGERKSAKLYFDKMHQRIQKEFNKQ